MAEYSTTTIPEISVIVCTYNRADLLMGALQSLVEQTLSPAQYEIIVVDNGSTDSTAEKILAFKHNHPQHLIICLSEMQRGLGFSRLTGAKHARGAFIGFLDDDAKADPHWLEYAHKLILQTLPPLHGFGGPILPFYLSPKPDWFKDEYEIRTWGETSRFLKKGEAFSGSNMFFNKEVFDQASGDLSRWGMVGDSMAFGDDNALFENVWDHFGSQACLIYSPDLIVFHAVPEYKMHVSYILRRQFSIGHSNYQRARSHQKNNWFLYGLHQKVGMIRLLGSAVVSIFKYPKKQNWAVEKLSPVVKKIGVLSAWIGISPRLSRS